MPIPTVAGTNGQIILDPCDIARILRESRQLSQGQVAIYLGISRQLISDFERGVSSLHLNKLLAIAEFYGQPLEWGGFAVGRSPVNQHREPLLPPRPVHARLSAIELKPH